MRRIGILTTHRANNFGALLQAYSLVNACQELGAQAEIIDWRCPFYDWQYHKSIRITRNPIAVMRHYFWHIFKETRARQLFDAFRDRLPLSRPIRSRKELLEIGMAYDKFVVGSDQVWNPQNSALRPEDFDRAFILDFVKEKSKNAYAASIGVDTIEPESVRAEFVNAWKHFDVITMREHEGAKYVSGLLGIHVDTVLDPVLLHDRHWWERMVVLRSSDAAPHVFEYNVRRVDGLDSFTRKIAAAEGAKVVNPIIPSFSFRRGKSFDSLGPAEFVSEIAQARSVVTSSFHAAAFSVIFGKRLYLIRRKKSCDPNSRFLSLLKFAKLDEKVVEESERYCVAEIDCDNADQVALSAERSASLNVLRQICLG